MHKGPYSGLSKAYAFVFKWIEENGYQIADSPRESYIDGIWNKDSEDEWLTELQIPIVRKN
jgi:effector-binding domain-containing protein